MATSNFIDTATIWLHAGKGGDGAVTFHREKYVAAGGPDGGDGGRGGDILFVADDNLSTLMDFRYKRKYTAPDGENGRAKRQSGADADDLVMPWYVRVRASLTAIGTELGNVRFVTRRGAPLDEYAFVTAPMTHRHLHDSLANMEVLSHYRILD